MGQALFRGYSVCLKQANEKGGVLGRRIELSVEDRDAISKLDFNTAFGAFKVNREGVQVAHKMLLFQWQDGKKVIVWPNELAPVKARLPTPPWSQR